MGTCQEYCKWGEVMEWQEFWQMYFSQLQANFEAVVQIFFV